MGGTESRTEKTEEYLMINHPRFNSPQFFQDKNDQKCIEVRLPVVNQNEYTHWIKLIKNCPKNSEVFLLPQQYSFEKEGFCGSNGYAKVLYESFPYVLTDEIKNRDRLEHKLFLEPELWYLLYTLLNAGYEFHQTGQKVGDIRPQNIFVNQDGQVKVATQITWPSEPSNYHKTFYEKQITYLAPEQLKDIQFGKTTPTCDEKLSESFSVGLTCLDAGTLNSSSNLFLKNYKFNYQGLESRLNDLQNSGYSELLVLVIKNLCETDPERRSSCSQLFLWLNPYEQSIINLEKFEVKELPAKISACNSKQSSPDRPSIISYSSNHPPALFSQNSVIQPQPNNNNLAPMYIVSIPFSNSVTMKDEKEASFNGQDQKKTVANGGSQYASAAYATNVRTDGRISNMQMTLDKIDEQLQQSRKMFPS